MKTKAKTKQSQASKAFYEIDAILAALKPQEQADVLKTLSWFYPLSKRPISKTNR